MKIAVSGAGGRMGQAIVRLASGEGMRIVGAIESGKSPALGRDAGELAGAGNIGVEVSADVAAGLLGAEIVIDFSSPLALPALLASAVRAKVGIVSGTTGLDATGERAVDEASRSIPVLSAPNMSIGVHVLARLVTQAVRQLGPGFDVEIVETHHRAKVDAPSGTAKRLLAAVEDGRAGIRALHGREGIVGPRQGDEVAVLAVRGGDVVGDHVVYLLGAGERIELVHRATNRDLFARGALAAARFLRGKPAGRYGIGDVVGE